VPGDSATDYVPVKETPVMTGGARVGQVWRLLRCRQAGLCYDVDERGSLASAVEALTAERAGVERLRRNALGFAQSEYTWERYENVLLALVEPR